MGQWEQLELWLDTEVVAERTTPRVSKKLCVGLHYDRPVWVKCGRVSTSAPEGVPVCSRCREKLNPSRLKRLKTVRAYAMKVWGWVPNDV